MSVKRLAIHHPGGGVRLGQNVFGKDVANLELFQALARYSEVDRLDVVVHTTADAAAVRTGLLGERPGPDIHVATPFDLDTIAEAGVLVRGSPKLETMAWQRRRHLGDTGFSLVGLIHTLAPPAMRAEMAQASIYPAQPWDALICTSPSVQSAMNRMYDEWEAYLADRFGAARTPRPQLPLIPLGVDADTLAARADKPGARSAGRARLGVADDDIVVLWVGRLSFFEKAFPQAMMRACAEAERRTGVRVHLAMAGWFPDGATGENLYREAAQACLGTERFHLLDGNDADVVGQAWAGADVFISLVDNIQETFGITPLEAMAAGLPVVVSDWDGYRYTVQDGEQGFLVRTLGGPPGQPPDRLASGHGWGLRTYQQYVGILAQHTPVDIEAAASALERLIREPGLRARMGEAGRRRVKQLFDWPMVARQYAALAGELTAIRRASSPMPPGPLPLNDDPFHDFQEFATELLGDDTRLRLGSETGDLNLLGGLDRFAAGWRGTPEEAKAVLTRLAAEGEMTVGRILATVPQDRRGRVRLSLLWLCKLGRLAWR